MSTPALRPALVLAAAAITALVVPATSAPVGAVADPTSTVFINELHYDNTGADVGEAVEVAAPAGTDLTGWTIVPYNGNGGAPYAPMGTLTGVVPDQGGGYGTQSVAVAGLQNGAPDGLALVDPGGVVEQFLSYEGSFTAVGGPANGLMSTDIGVLQVGTEPVGSSLALTGTGDAYGDFAWTATTAASFGMPNVGQTFGGGPTSTSTSTTTSTTTTTTTLPPSGACAAAPEETPISTVQGRSDTSPCVGQTVVIEGVVVGDYEGASPALRGFYVQSRDVKQDADAATSEGIFVFNGGANAVNLGDAVSVTGRVSEFQGQTQLEAPAVSVLGSGVTVAAAAVTLPFPGPDHLERFEGMLATFAQELTVTEHFQLGRFGQIVVSSNGRLPQPTAVAEPGDAANGVAAENALNRLIVDDALQNQNPDPILFGRAGDPLSARNTLRGGDTVTGLTGVLTYTWAGNAASGNAYRLRPINDLSDTGLVPGGDVPDFEPADPRPPDAPEVGGTLTIANFNVLNYFLTLDAGGNQCGPVGSEQDCRGAETETERARQRVKLLAALERLDADIIGLIELENTPDVQPLEDIVAGLNDSPGGGTYDFVDTGVIGTDAIRVGIIYRPAVVTPVGGFAIIDESVDPDFDTSRNRPSLAQSFADTSTGEIMTVVVNHLKSKGCDEATGLDADQFDGQSCWNPTRVAAVEALVEWVQNAPTGVRDDDVLVLGDLNSYASEDPIDVLVGARFVDLVAAGGAGYSFAFDGQWGSLDYAFASPSLASQATGAADDHINADEPSVLDYNTNFKTAGQVASLFAPDEFRTSDHDPVVSGFQLGAMHTQALALPFLLFPPDHRLREVTVLGWTGDGLADVTIESVSSSEPDSGLGPHDVPGDIGPPDGATVELRSEAFNRPARTYVITAVVSDGEQAELATARVFVPFLRGF